ncbi:ribonuclease P protein component [Candidatus Dojkabacteria bacterium]|uniref:Ribonuclease P protein component n=1 Tax=Candidatus Dojkabacteria bacterium TaxID=2099670 RepID=A0A5C7J6S2_9BACT|nr:MAG: ribonuclease P protein component [Candidatus Dojkabacteria bacterium]
MLGKPYRLREKRLFQEVFSHGQRNFIQGVGCFSLPSKNGTLIGVTFTQRAFPRSVTRHYYKRLTLHIIRELFPMLPPGKALVFHFQRPLTPVSKEVLAPILRTLLQRIR